MKIQFLIFIVLVWSLDAKSIVALLKSVEDNDNLHMVYQQKDFVCKPYGIQSINALISSIDVNSSCMTYLMDFRKSNPKEKFFAQVSLEVQQLYSVKGVEGKCLLHLSSGHTYSEAILEAGYARIPITLKYDDPLLKYRFKRALQRAKSSKLGIWSDVNVRNCFLVSPK
jgi:hypothetical protein